MRLFTSRQIDFDFDIFSLLIMQLRSMLSRFVVAFTKLSRGS
jgi:hypothetical protein